MSETLLIIEDEELLAQELARHFRRGGWEVMVAPDLAAARRFLVEQQLEPLVVLSDMSLPDGNALDLLEEIRRSSPAGEWILLTAYGTIPDSVRALRLGAFDFLEKPCPSERLDLVMAGAARSARAQRRLHRETLAQHRRFSPESLVGSSTATGSLRQMVRKLAGVPFSTLVVAGETGTGKGLVARVLHYSGGRAAGPMVEINCAALPAELLESELFGHESGAFTGAKRRHRGLLEQATGGTLFLDEIGELDLGLQAKLLKAIEDQQVRRLGAEREVSVDVQIIAASNQDLLTQVHQGSFRSDLYHRLSVFRLEIAPLRDRLDDLEDLVPLFINEFNIAAGKHVSLIQDQAWETMRRHHWPGNVRELRNAVERCVLLAEGDRFPHQWLQLDSPSVSGAWEPGETSTDTFQVPLDGSVHLDDIERRVIEEALARTGHNVTSAARLLGTTRQTLRYRIQKHGLDHEA